MYFDHSDPQNVGHLFIAIRPDLIVTKEEFTKRMDTFVKRVGTQPKTKGLDEILIPGEPEDRTAKKRLAEGIPITEKVV